MADRPPRDLQKLHQLALDQFKTTAQAEYAQRKRELEDLKFADPIEPEDQWPKDALQSRAGIPSVGTFPAVPARPALTINKLRQPIQQVQAQMRQARLSLQFVPEGDGSSRDVAAAYEDIARAVQNDSRAHLARNWAFDRAIKCGRGFYRIDTEYVNDRSFDQKICYNRILNQFGVYFYPFCQQPDNSDAKWCFVTDDMPVVEFKRKYPESDLADMTSEELTALGNDRPGWIGDTEQGKTIRVAEWFFFETTTAELVAVTVNGQPQAVLKSEIPAGALPILDEDGEPLTRSIEQKQLCWAKLTATGFVKDEGQAEDICEKDGEFIPIVPVYADESNRAGERVWTGIVRPAIHAQRLFNVEASTLAESVHLAPLAPYVGFANQFEGYEQFWAQLNVRRFPYLPINPPTNQIEASLPLPQRNTAEQPIQAIAISLQQAENYIHATTGMPPPALGAIDPHERSGKAILALQKQAELGTSGYLDNLANMSMLLEGKILQGLIPKIYDRHGRFVPAQGDDDSRRVVVLNAPFVEQKDAPPQIVPPGTPGSKVIDLTQGQYAVAATVGKSFTTKREEGAEQMGELASAMPNFVPAFADLWVGNMDFPGARQIADRLARLVPAQARDQQPGQADPVVLQQQLGQASKIIEELTAHVNQLSEMVKTEQVKAQERLAEKQIDAQVRIEVAKIQSGAQLAVADIKSQLDAAKVAAEQLRSLVDAAEESRLAREQHLHDHRESTKQHAHEVGMAAVEHAHAMQQAQAEHDQAMEQAALGHQAALAQNAQQAALQPAPDATGQP